VLILPFESNKVLYKYLCKQCAYSLQNKLQFHMSNIYSHEKCSLLGRNVCILVEIYGPTGGIRFLNLQDRRLTMNKTVQLS